MQIWNNKIDFYIIEIYPEDKFEREDSSAQFLSMEDIIEIEWWFPFKATQSLLCHCFEI